MKKRIFGLSILAIMLVVGLSFTSTEVAVAQSITVIDAGDKGDLYGNSSGTKYCCKASDYKDCGAAACP